MCKQNSASPINTNTVPEDQQNQQIDQENHHSQQPNQSSKNSRKRRNHSPSVATKAKAQKPTVNLVIRKEDENSDIVVHYGENGHLQVENGKIIRGKYRIIKCIGTGGFAIVYLAREVRTKRMVAVKITRCGEESNMCAEREVEFMKAAGESSYIVRLIDDFSVKGPHGRHYVMVFEMMGPDLFDVLVQSNQTELTCDRIRKFCRDILMGMDQLHSQGIIHLDLKIENILMTIGDNEPGQDSYNMDLSDPSCTASLKIGDFGQALWETEELNRRVQNCAYRAPEAFIGSKVGVPADKWSFGVIAYNMATGYLLFQCDHDGCSEFMDISCLIPAFRAKLCPGEIQKYSKMNEQEASMFSDFMLRIVQLRPEDRLAAREALEHPFVKIN